MKTLLSIARRIIASVPLLLISPLLLLAPLLALAAADLLSYFRGRRQLADNRRPNSRSASVVIPNWNGRHLLATYLPSVIDALENHPENEIIVVDNASEDGSAAFVRDRFPGVRVIQLERNYGFGGGSNAGFRAARNDIVVLLNSDMRVERGFLQPLLDAFGDEKRFAVSCQIYFTDPARLREETGITQGWWENGGLRVRHRDDDAIDCPYPCFYAGGGSSAFDRRKFLELGGFDELFAPFYLEDTDLSYMAWKRGWNVLYHPRSVVYHEHRGTIGKKFRPGQIDLVLKKNYLLFCWKNIHAWRLLWPHFFFAYSGAALSAVFGDSPERASLRGLFRAALELPAAVRSRLRARALAQIGDTEAFQRPLGGYFRDRFSALPPDPENPSVLFVSPYPLCPPIHGGAVFMYQTARELARRASLHLVILLDHEWEREPHAQLQPGVASMHFLVRPESKPKEFASMLPYAVREFASADLEWLLHRLIYTLGIDIVQFEYTALSQYALRFRQIACILFEHDIYFQSIGRALPGMRGALRKTKAAFEYLRALRYELTMLPRFDRIQVCSAENKEYLASFQPGLRARIDDDLRAGIETRRYAFRPQGREPHTMLFLGSFRHTPNREALAWFTRQVLPGVLARSPAARLVVIGSDPPQRHSLPNLPGAIELRGFVDDVREPLGRYAVFVCPILSGSGVRVKLLEAFASGIPVVSTRLGAEGLASDDGEICMLADDPAAFAEKILDLFADPLRARELAERARRAVVETKDIDAMTNRLLLSYRKAVREKRARP